MVLNVFPKYSSLVKLNVSINIPQLPQQTNYVCVIAAAPYQCNDILPFE